MPESIITEDMLVAALQAAATATHSSPGLTVRDIKARTGWGEKRIRDYLRPLVEEGKITVHTVNRMACNGIMKPTYAYVMRSES